MTASVFESFNAKNLAPHQVARTFIPPAKQFRELCSRSHAVVIGPRGSGKTTLLKMLQLTSLSHWRHSTAAEYREQIDFVGVFVGADIVWHEQIKSLAERLPPLARERLAIATFTTHTFISLVSAFDEALAPEISKGTSLSRFRIALRPEDEGTLVSVLADAWQIKPELPSLLGIKLALRHRLGHIASWVEQLQLLDECAILERLDTAPWLFLSFYEHALTAIEAINGLAGKATLTWALLFDELEVAPDQIRRRLLSLLRGTDPRILLKLSISPYNSDFAVLSDEIGAKPGHDYLPVALWYSEKDDAVPFARELTSSILADAGIYNVNADTVFGTSAFDIGKFEQHELGSAYGPRSSNYRRFADLASRDPTFRAYLEKHGVNLKQMHQIFDKQRAAQIRKITSVVTVREAYFRQPSIGQRVRSRKRPQLFSGSTALFAITEGNPRWIIGTLGPMLKAFAATGKSVRREDQIRTVLVAVERFRALLSTVSVSEYGKPHRSGSLLSLIDDIGGRFHQNVVIAPFSPEPPTTFRVDAGVPEPIMAALKVALNVGAIVFIPDNPGETILDDLTGKRFRLTYLLSPYYRIPPTIGKERDLSGILRDIDIARLTPDLFSGAPA